MPGTKILIAEDEADALEMMVKMVSREGYNVIKACDGKEALEKIYSDFPDLVILDIIMPKMDGFGVLKKLREKPASEKWMPVIIVSGKGDLEHIKKGYDLEADYYLTKPFSMNALLNSIKTMLNLVPQRRTKDQTDKSS